MSIIQVSYGANHLAILLANGKVLTCGSNQTGQLGRITQKEINNPKFDYIDDTNFQNLKVVKIASGYQHMLILLENGKVLSCGNNHQGQLGRNYTNVTSIFNYVDDKNFRDIRVVDVICGPANSAIILENGKCLTCGDNSYGNPYKNLFQNPYLYEIDEDVMNDRYQQLDDIIKTININL